MAYNLSRYNGSTEVPDNGVTAIAGITLPGKNYLGYGVIVDQALLNMVENFASNDSPANPIKGQIWYQANTDIMRYNRGDTTTPDWANLLVSGGAANITSGDVTGLGNLSSANGTIGNLNATTAVVTGNIAGGNINTSGQVVAGGTITGGNLATGGNLSVTGNGAIAGNLAVVGNISGGNLSTAGNISGGNLSVTGNGAISGNLAVVGNISGGNISTTGNIAGGNLSVTGNGAISGNLAVVGNISGGNLSTAGNISGGNLSVTGNITGTLTNKITFNASGQGIAMGPGNIYDAASNIVVSWNTVGAASGNATGWANVGLGPVSNAQVKITGGTAGQVLVATGTGDLDWVTPGTFTGGITTPGTITGGNLATGGNLSVTGNGAISGNLAVTGNISGGNLSTTGNISGVNIAVTGNGAIGGNLAVTGNISGGNISTTGNISGSITGTLVNEVTFDSGGGGAASGAVYDATSAVKVSWDTLGAAVGNATGWASVGLGPVPNASVRITGGTSGQVLSTDGTGVLSWVTPGGSGVTTTSITTGAPTTAGTITGAWTLTAGSKLEATYADLAERHHSDAEYPVGTVMTVGGVNEVTACPISVTPLGVISNQYAYLMNSEAGPDETHPAVGYLGRVPVRVIGPITKHQRIAPAGGGVATAADENSFGWALESNDEVGEKLVLCLIK